MEGPDISEYYSGGSGTLKASDIDDGIIVTVKGWREFKFPNDSKPTLFLQLENEEKEFRCNVTNMKRIAEMYGTKVAGWVGKSLELIPDRYKDRQGKEGDTISVRIRRTPRNAPKTTVTRAQQYDERNPPPPLDDEIPF